MTIAESADKLNRAMELPEGVSIAAPVSAEYQSILTFEALSHLAQLHRQFEPRRRELLAARVTRAAELDAGKPMDFLADTLHVREGNWKIAPLPTTAVLANPIAIPEAAGRLCSRTDANRSQ